MTSRVTHALSSCLKLMLVAAIGASLVGCGGGPVPPPTSYKEYSTKDGGWACEYPEGWDADGGGKKNSWAKFSKSSAAIKLQTDVTGSVLGDIASAGGGTKLGPPSDEDYPVHKVHLQGKEQTAGEFGDYKEKDPVKFNNSIGDGRKSEFTASGGFSGPLRGYRATFLSRDRRFTVICTCSEGDWKGLQPAFDKVLESFRSAG